MGIKYIVGNKKLLNIDPDVSLKGLETIGYCLLELIN